MAQPLHIFLHALLNRHEWMITTDGPQRTHIRLRKALIAASQMVWKGNVFDLASTVAFDHRTGYRIEGLTAAGTEIEYARDLGVVKRPQVHGTYIIDMDEVTALFTIAVPPLPRKSLHRPSARSSFWNWNAVLAIAPLCSSRGPYTLK